MKNILVVTPLILGAVLPVSAEVLWHADPEKSTQVKTYFKRLDSGNYPQDYCKGKHSEQTPTVDVVDDKQFGKVWRVTKPVDRKRAEFARTTGYIPKEGDDVYIGYRWKISAKPSINDEVTVWQWKSSGEHNQNYPVVLEYDGHLSLNAFGQDSYGGKWPSTRRVVLWKQVVPQDTWVDIVIRIKHSKADKSQKQGFVEFWFNGEKQELSQGDGKRYTVDLSEDKMRAYHRTGDGDQNYNKWGSYNLKSCKYDIQTYYGDMKIATSYADAQPVLLAR